ncbi:MAG: hypothetical protein NTW29_06250 [Bacteroidetes bacterium]|nr:hypothetical protein [Bacteroidota bacterium]
MALHKKKVEVFELSITSDEDYLFEDILTSEDVVEIEQFVVGKISSIKILKNGQNVIVGLVETTRDKNIPPKKNRRSKKVQSLGLTSEEGLAYANVFLYEKKRKLLMYEVNKFGCYVNHFLELIYKCCRDGETYSNFNLEINALLKANEYKRFLQMRFHKSLEVQIAYPSEIIKEYKHKKDALWNLCSEGKAMHSERVHAKFEVMVHGGGNGLASNNLKSLVDRIRDVANGPNSRNVEKLIVVGYERDSDDGGLQPIDLIADRMLKEIELDEPRDNSDLLEWQRQNQIEKLYKSCLDEFKVLKGKL